MKKLAFVVLGCLLVPSCASGPAIPKDAVFLGERTVPFAGDHDVLQVGGDAGRFSSLFFVVEKNDIELYDMVVTYGNGVKKKFDTRLNCSADSRSRRLQLDGKRFIKTIAFTYKTVGSWLDGRARVVVYGLG